VKPISLGNLINIWPVLAYVLPAVLLASLAVASHAPSSWLLPWLPVGLPFTRSSWQALAVSPSPLLG